MLAMPWLWDLLLISLNDISSRIVLISSTDHWFCFVGVSALIALIHSSSRRPRGASKHSVISARKWSWLTKIMLSAFLSISLAFLSDMIRIFGYPSTPLKSYKKARLMLLIQPYIQIIYRLSFPHSLFTFRWWFMILIISFRENILSNDNVILQWDLDILYNIILLWQNVNTQ